MHLGENAVGSEEKKKTIKLNIGKDNAYFVESLAHVPYIVKE